MTPIPSIPQRTVAIEFGRRTSGSEVIECRVERCAAPAGRSVPSGVAAGAVELTIDGTWVVAVPASGSQHIDLTSNSAFTDDGWRAAGAALVRRLNPVIDGHPVRAKKHLVQIEVPEEVTADNLRSFAIGLVVGGHTFEVTNQRRPAKVRSVRIVKREVHDDAALPAAIASGVELGEATCLSRDLANTPANVKNPEWLAKKAAKLVSDIPGVKVRVRDQQWLRDKGFGGILAVAGGSANAPVLIELVWDPESVDKKRRRQSVLLVGKGVTFDTGGLSLKPAKGMETMITDMTGGASVIAAFRALARQQVSRKIVALIPSAENMVDAGSYRPGDIIEHYGGLTTEITNTDAEGRLLLADAISYGVKKYKPAAVVSIATLTGAAKLALGLRTGAVFAPERGAALKLARRGAAVGESWWPLPLPEYLEDEVDSRVADVCQTPKGPGAITAAMFLRRFTRGVPLVHLDIAGPGRAESTYAEVTPLGTGFGARTLVQWLGK